MPAGFSLVARLAASAIAGNLDGVLEKKFESLLEELLMKELGGGFGSVDKLASLFGGQSNFDKLRDQWLNKSKASSGSAQDLLGKLFGTMDKGSKSGRAGKARYTSKWSRSEWARSRSDWLDNHWKHDWRSQPRNAEGRWIPGRLDQIELALQYKGMKKGRKTKRRRKLRRAARMRGRKAAKQLFRR